MREAGKADFGGGMEVTIRNSQRRYPVDRERLQSLARRALEVLGLEEAQLSVLIAGDRRVRELNRTYRGIDSATDVLAFSQAEGEGGHFHPSLLGDIVISAETARRNAGRLRRPLEKELDTLLVHGILHLAGYDHEGAEAQRVEMKKRAGQILRKWRR